jgi:gas vesicle protein
MKGICGSIFVLLFLVAGCQEEDYQIKVRFREVGNLETDSPVFIKEGDRIGRVADIQTSGAGKLVTLSIDPEKKEAITEFVNFMIAAGPGEGSQYAVEVTTTRQGGAPLPRGSVVDGIELRPPGLVEQIRKEVKQELRRLDRHFDGISREVDTLIQELQTLPEKQAVKEMEKELEDLGRAIRESSQEWKERIQKELLPELKKEIDRLKEKLKEKGREKDAEPLEIKMDELQTI